MQRESFKPLNPREIIQTICVSFRGVQPKYSWGETSLFYNPEGLLPNGVYFCTVKENDSKHDRASKLNRAEIFRVAIGLHPTTYNHLFGLKPNRPEKGGIIDTGHDFAVVNELMPHPIYGWMSWSQILSPTEEKFQEVFPLIAEAYQVAANKYEKKVSRK